MYSTERDRAPDPSVSSLGDLLRDLSKNAFDLVRDEVQLAAAETSRKISKAGKDALVVKIGASVVYAGFLFILGAAVVALSLLIPAGWAALLVGVTTLLAGATTMYVGKNRLREDDLIPRETISTIREGTKWMRDQLM